MATPGQQFTNPAGDTLRFVRTSTETQGAFLELMVAYVPDRPAPPLHRHPRQTERFEVLSGMVEVRLGQETKRYEAGARFEVPPGLVHTMRNGGADLLQMRWTITPALTSESLTEALWSLAASGRTDVNGRPPFLQSAVLLQRHADAFQLAFPPAPVQRLLLALLGPLGRLRGYRPSV